MSKTIKAVNFVLHLITGKGFEYGDNVNKYLAINTMTDGWYEERKKHSAIQFKTKKELKDWIKDNIAKNEQHFWIVYRLEETT